MAGKYILGCFLVLLVAWEINCQKEGPPVVGKSYKAIGEMVETLEDESQILTQIAFEETYDGERQMAAFRVWMVGMNVTFVENFATNQTFQINQTGCSEMTVSEWIKTPSPPSLTAYEDINGTVRFSLKQLFALDKKYLKEFNQPATFRGIPAKKWMYEIRGTDPETKKSSILNIYAFWSDGSFSTSASDKIVPLGYIVTRMNYTKNNPRFKIHEQFINVFQFEAGITDLKLLEPIQGFVCPGRKQTLPFPDPSNLQAVEIRSEVIVPTDREIRYVDTWLDTKNKIIRMDLERIDLETPVFEDKTRDYQSEIAILEHGIVYRVSYSKGTFDCKVIAIKDYAHDPQNLYNIKLGKDDWNVAKLFGNLANYVYIGKTYKRDVPCHMFQGVRTDWPDPDAGVESLWEWCFATTNLTNMNTKRDDIIFKNEDYGLVHGQFKILKSGSNIFYPSLEMKHHFYKVQKQDPDVMQATTFDITRCFAQDERRALEFAVNFPVNENTEPYVERMVADRTFLAKWKLQLYKYAGINPNTLRITKLYATVVDKKLFVRFTILNPHKDLPAEIKKNQKTAFEAENILRKQINNGKGGVFVSFRPYGNATMVQLKVLEHSLEPQIKTDFTLHTTTVKTTRVIETTSKPPFTLRPDPEDEKSSLPTTPTKPTSQPGGSSTSQQPDGSSTAPQPDGTSIAPQPDSSTTSEQPDGSSTTPGVTTPKQIKDESGKKSGENHGPGTVAGVSIAMLLVGVSLGSTGIFIKMNGLPSFMKSG